MLERGRERGWGPILVHPFLVGHVVHNLLTFQSCMIKILTNVWICTYSLMHMFQTSKLLCWRFHNRSFNRPELPPWTWLYFGHFYHNKCSNLHIFCHQKIVLVKTVPSRFYSPPKDFFFTSYGPYWTKREERYIRHLGTPSFKNKLAKARKMRKPPSTLGLKKFGPGKIWVENSWTQNTCILAFLHTFILISGNPTKTQNIFYRFSHWIRWF